MLKKWTKPELTANQTSKGKGLEESFNYFNWTLSAPVKSWRSSLFFSRLPLFCSPECRHQGYQPPFRIPPLSPCTLHTGPPGFQFALVKVLMTPVLCRKPWLIRDVSALCWHWCASERSSLPPATSDLAAASGPSAAVSSTTSRPVSWINA